MGMASTGFIYLDDLKQKRKDLHIPFTVYNAQVFKGIPIKMAIAISKKNSEGTISPPKITPKTNEIHFV